ncbi:serine/threonine protein kinase [Spiractinospora alimapuensis]|uniref:serine/threonine-protein kinase n=1 Tax=Spiractinospora alimapuensis TaxID=2820884 RepID=UPI001F22EBA7|nr:serine/threonine-protein kinase [Spiractinospora alimapuensis]QVQ50342.1 serine/threonine protein kinase [Spiractinospora alimapuensis]
MNSSDVDAGHLLADRYRLDETIGTGGMGRVWRGTDTLLDRAIAVKELTTPANLTAQDVEVLRTRMQREARSAAKLSHPTIITIYDVVEEDGRPWIVMELIKGPSLSDIIRGEGPLTVHRAASIAAQMAGALAEAHNHGIVHRDIKPGNVLVAANDRAVLTDFGIAHLDGSTHLTSTGLLIGSPSYLAPEVAHGRPASPASDMWALGVTLFQSLEGSLPFDRSSPMSTLTAIVTEDLPHSPNAGPLRPLLDALCSKEPGNRPSAVEARAQLRALRDAAAAAPPRPKDTRETPPPVPPTPPAPKPAPVYAAPTPEPGPETSAPTGNGLARGATRRTALVAGAVAVLLALGVGIVALVNTLRPDPEPMADAEEAPDEETAPPDEEEEEPEEEEDDEWDFLTRHEDDSGFAVDVPEDWDYDPDGQMVYFRNPDGGYLQIDQTDNPNEDAGDDWRDLESRINSNFSNYSLIGIEDVDADWTDPYVSAADWEFTFDGSDGELHAINRGFHTEDYGYALFLVSPDSQDDNHALLDRMAESFEPAS